MSWMPFCFTFRICQRVPVPSFAPWRRTSSGNSIPPVFASEAHAVSFVSSALLGFDSHFARRHDHRQLRDGLKAPEISTPDRHRIRRPLPLRTPGSTPCPRQNCPRRSFPRLAIRCAICGREMKLIMVQPPSKIPPTPTKARTITGTESLRSMCEAASVGGLWHLAVVQLIGGLGRRLCCLDSCHLDPGLGNFEQLLLVLAIHAVGKVPRSRAPVRDIPLRSQPPPPSSDPNSFSGFVRSELFDFRHNMGAARFKGRFFDILRHGKTAPCTGPAEGQQPQRPMVQII